MKKVLGVTLMLVSLGVFGLSAQAKSLESSNSTMTVEASAAPQWQRGRYSRRNYDRRRRTFTRVVRHGRRLYRETYLVTYSSWGGSNTRLISRVRIS